MRSVFDKRLGDVEKLLNSPVLGGGGGNSSDGGPVTAVPIAPAVMAQRRKFAASVLTAARNSSQASSSGKKAQQQSQASFLSELLLLFEPGRDEGRLLKILELLVMAAPEDGLPSHDASSSGTSGAGVSLSIFLPDQDPDDVNAFVEAIVRKNSHHDRKTEAGAGGDNTVLSSSTENNVSDEKRKAMMASVTMQVRQLWRWKRLFFLSFEYLSGRRSIVSSASGRSSTSSARGSSRVSETSTSPTLNCQHEILNLLDLLRAPGVIRAFGGFPRLFHFLRDCSEYEGARPSVAGRKAAAERGSRLWLKFSPLNWSTLDVGSMRRRDVRRIILGIHNTNSSASSCEIEEGGSRTPGGGPPNSSACARAQEDTKK